MSTIQLPIWSEKETSYISGIVDGEGCIGIYRHRDKRGNWLIIQITIANTNRKLILWLKKKFGNDNVSIVKTDLGWKYWYTIKATGERSYRIILRIKNNLIVKRKQADNLISYWNWSTKAKKKHMKRVNKKNGRYLKYTNNQNRIRENFLLQSHKLNKRGRMKN